MIILLKEIIIYSFKIFKMETEEEIKKRNTTRMIVLFLIIFLAVILASIKSDASETVSKKEKLEIGYQVVVSIGKFHSNKKVIDFTIAQKIVSTHFPDSVDLKNLMFNSHHVNIDSGRINIYVERKIIIKKRGKFRFKKIRKRHNKQLI